MTSSAFSDTDVLKQMLMLSFNLSDRKLTIAIALPRSLSYDPTDRASFVTTLVYFDKLLVCLFSNLFEDMFRGVGSRAESGDLQLIPMHVLDYLVLFVLAVWGVKCRSVTHDEKLCFHLRPEGEGARQLASLIQAHLSAANALVTMNRWSLIVEQQRLSGGGLTSPEKTKTTKKRGDKLEPAAETAPAKRSNRGDPVDQATTLCTAHAMNLLKVKGAAGCTFKDCKRIHDETLVSGGKEAALALISKHASTEQLGKLTIIANAFKGF
jgi:hypothetical protein